VPGGTFDRGGTSPPSPATLSPFSLDRFEVTVGRFRAFVAAYPGSKPAPGAGAHPLIPGSGWDPAWPLPGDASALSAAVGSCSPTTWTPDPTPDGDALPMTCLDWYTAFAFCAWDGGRLPTEAEWYYAAAGGTPEREYPWSNPADSSMIDSDYAVYDCIELPSCGLLGVGSKSPLGDGRWGQADLGGSVWEWNLDWFNPGDAYVDPAGCDDCANLDSSTSTSPPTRVLRGGSWLSYAPDLANASRSNAAPSDPFTDGPGVRCAR